MTICSPRQTCKVIPTPLYTHRPSQTPLSRAITWPAHTHRFTPTIPKTDMHTETCTHSHTFSITHIHPHLGTGAPDVPDHRLCPLPSTPNASSKKSVLQGPNLSYSHREFSGAQSFPSCCFSSGSWLLTQCSITSPYPETSWQAPPLLHFRFYVSNSMGFIPHRSGCCVGHTPVLPEALWSQKLHSALSSSPTNHWLQANSCQVSP